MPSPLAHASLACLARTTLLHQRLEHLPRGRRWSFYALVVFALCVPDVDFALLLVSDHPMLGHGTLTHSLVAALLFAPLFGLLARGLLGRAMAWRWLALVGLLAYGSHLLLDVFTPGRGIMLMWPFSVERVGSPVPLFVGAEHSQPWAWRWHLLTFSTEAAFAAGVWLAARGFDRCLRGHAVPAPDHPGRSPRPAGQHVANSDKASIPHPPGSARSADHRP